MGDSGALTLGLLMSAATITLTGNVDPSQVSTNEVSAAFLPILLPLAVLLLPLLVMELAVVRRTLAGQRPWHPDAKHLHHRMLSIGHTHRRAVLILYLGTREPGGIMQGLFIAAAVSRVFHAAGMIMSPSLARPQPLRAAGAVGTYVVGLILAVMVIVLAMGV